jgi:hypothetical protein
MENYHPILMKIGTQTKESMPTLKVKTPEVTIKFEDGRRCHVGNSSACYKIGNYHPIFTQIGTQTKKNMLSSTFIRPEV